MRPEELEVMREIDCPEIPESYRKRKTPRVGAQDVDEEESDLEQN